MQLRQIRLTAGSLTFQAHSSLPARGRLSGRMRSIGAGGSARMRSHRTLGTKRFRLSAGAWRSIKLTLTAPLRKLLGAHRAARADVTVTVVADDGQTTTLTRTVAVASTAQRR